MLNLPRQLYDRKRLQNSSSQGRAINPGPAFSVGSGGAILHRSTSGGARNPAQPCRFLPCLKNLGDIVEICSTGLGIPKLGEHRFPPLRTGRTGVTWADPTLDWAVVLHQLGRKHRNPVTNPSSRKSDPPEELRFLLSCPLHPCSRGTPGCCDQRPVPPQLGSSTISPHPGGFSRAIPSSSFLWTFLIQFSPRPQPFPGQRVQPRQQSPSPSRARGPSPAAKH